MSEAIAQVNADTKNYSHLTPGQAAFAMSLADADVNAPLLTRGIAAGDSSPGSLSADREIIERAPEME